MEGQRAGRILAAELLAACEAALARELTPDAAEIVGAYIHGSLAAGGYVPGQSDVDLLVVVDRPLTEPQRSSLLHALDGIGPTRRRRFDLTIVTAETASRATSRPIAEVYYGWHGASPEIVITDHLPSLVVELSAMRESAEVLIGPPPMALVTDQPAELIDQRGLELLDRWSRLTDDAVHAELMVLVACQIWRWAVERRHVSKDAAGRWAFEQDSTLTAVEIALARRRGDQSPTMDPGDVRRVLDRARIALGRSSRS